MTVNHGYDIDKDFNGHLWQHPGSYAGHSPSGDIVLYSRHRGSTILENTNYTALMAEAAKLNKRYVPSDFEPFIYDFRAGCSLVGWVEYIIVKRSAPVEVLDWAYETLGALEAYPVLCDSSYSEAQYNAIVDYWARESLATRVELCGEAGVSMFAARREGIPGAVFDELSQSEMFY